MGAKGKIDISMLQKLLLEGYNNSYIANLMGVSRQAVSLQAKSLGISVDSLKHEKHKRAANQRGSLDVSAVAMKKQAQATARNALKVGEAVISAREENSRIIVDKSLDGKRKAIDYYTEMLDKERAKPLEEQSFQLITSIDNQFHKNLELSAYIRQRLGADNEKVETQAIINYDIPVTQNEVNKDGN